MSDEKEDDQSSQFAGPSRIVSSDLLAAETVCNHLSQNLAIRYQLNGDQWSREEAEKHFNQRRALTIVRDLLIDEAESLLR